MLGAQLRKIYGHGGTVVSQTFDLADANAPTNYQIRVSSEELQTALAAVQQKVSAFSSTGFLSGTTYATWVTGNLNIQAAKASYVFLTPLSSFRRR